MLSPTIIVVPFFHRPVYSIQHAVTDDYCCPFLPQTSIFHTTCCHRRLFHTTCCPFLPQTSIFHTTCCHRRLLSCPFLPQTSIFHTTCCHRRLLLSLSSTDQYIPYNMLSPTIIVVPFFHRPVYSIQHAVTLLLSLSSTEPVYSIQHAVTDDYCCPFLPQTSIFHSEHVVPFFHQSYSAVTNDFFFHRPVYSIQHAPTINSQYIPYNMLSPTIIPYNMLSPTIVVPFFHRPVYSIQHAVTDDYSCPFLPQYIPYNMVTDDYCYCIMLDIPYNICHR